MVPAVAERKDHGHGHGTPKRCRTEPWRTDAMNPTPTRLTPLEITVARHARSHDIHVSPIVGCYLCLHGVARAASPATRRAAAA
jgi:hypothetical protein